MNNKCVKGTPTKHHWILETPNGKLSEGICKNCGESKMFPNILPWMEEGNPSHWSTSKKRELLAKAETKNKMFKF